jgi:hypothetical protein
MVLASKDISVRGCRIAGVAEACRRSSSSAEAMALCVRSGFRAFKSLGRLASNLEFSQFLYGSDYQAQVFRFDK